MLAHMLDHFIFSSRRLRHQTKSIVFGVCAFSIVATFWWFSGLAFGIEGPINDHKGLQWRKVRSPYLDLPSWLMSYFAELEHLS